MADSAAGGASDYAKDTVGEQAVSGLHCRMVRLPAPPP